MVFSSDVAVALFAVIVTASAFVNHVQDAQITPNNGWRRGSGFNSMRPTRGNAFITALSSPSTKIDSRRVEGLSSSKTERTSSLGENATETEKDVSSINDTSLQSSIYSDKSTHIGLLSDSAFDLLCRSHCTVTLLRKHFPSLLELPALSSSTAQWIYSENVTVTGPRGEQLAVGLDEVLLLSKALASAATAARRAGGLLDFAAGSGTTVSAPSDGNRKVECELLVDPHNSLQYLVLWRALLPSIGKFPAASSFGNNANGEKGLLSSSYTEFSGKSVVEISSDAGLVNNLQIKEVRVNGVAIIETLGTALAAVRRAAQSAMSMSSIFDNGTGDVKKNTGNPFLTGILSGIQDVADAVEALPSEEEADRSDASLYIVPNHLWDGAYFPIINCTNFSGASENAGNNASADATSSYGPVLMEQYVQNGEMPLVGSNAFVKFAIVHEALHFFAKQGLHQLAGTSKSDLEGRNDEDVTSEKLRSLFTTDAELVSLGIAGQNKRKDRVTLLSGAGRIADFYRYLALFREASGGNWRIKSLEADTDSRRLIVRWRTETPLQIDGTDSFLVESPSLTSSYRLPLTSDGDKEDVAKRCAFYFNENSDDDLSLKIMEIKNLELNIAGVNADSVWAQSFVSAALQSGFAGSTSLPDATITDLIHSLATRKPTSNRATSKSETGMPALEDSAAARFYGVLHALHNDLPHIASPISGSITPAGEFISDNIELRGLLGEVLGRGSTSYRRLIGVAISSLRTALQANAVRLAASPLKTIEVTSKGSIKVTLVLDLRVAPNIPLLGGEMGQKESGVPLKVEISSEYIIDQSGRIREHLILESRLNGVLTPGDILSKWIKGMPREDDASSTPSAMDSWMDVLTFVRSMQERT